MTERLIVIGGGGAGTAASTIAKRMKPSLHVSVFTEFVQLYSLKRFPAMQDVVCNVAGAAAGALLVSLVNRDSPEDTL